MSDGTKAPDGEGGGLPPWSKLDDPAWRREHERLEAVAHAAVAALLTHSGAMILSSPFDHQGERHTLVAGSVENMGVMFTGSSAVGLAHLVRERHLVVSEHAKAADHLRETASCHVRMAQRGASLELADVLAKALLLGRIQAVLANDLKEQHAEGCPFCPSGHNPGEGQPH